MSKLFEAVYQHAVKESMPMAQTPDDDIDEIRKMTKDFCQQIVDRFPIPKNKYVMLREALFNIMLRCYHYNDSYDYSKFKDFERYTEY